MTSQTLFKKDIIQVIRSAKEATIVQPVQVGETTRENELVFFIKPELLDVVVMSEFRDLDI